VVGDIDRSIATVCTALAERARLLGGALRQHIPDARFTEPEGGYFLWIDLPENVDVNELDVLARDRGVVFVKGTDFLLEGGASSLRIAYSGVPAGQIDEAVQRIAAAYGDLSGSAAA
jgi:DNA-binding transcriptional MocR family regulator